MKSIVVNIDTHNKMLKQGKNCTKQTKNYIVSNGVKRPECPLDINMTGKRLVGASQSPHSWNNRSHINWKYHDRSVYLYCKSAHYTCTYRVNPL